MQKILNRSDTFSTVALATGPRLRGYLDLVVVKWSEEEEREAEGGRIGGNLALGLGLAIFTLPWC